MFDDLDEAAARRYHREAWLEICRYTSDRLRVARPDNSEDSALVSDCAYAVAEALYLIDQAQTSANTATINGVETTVAGPVSSVSAGSESISFKTTETVYTEAARNPRKRDALIEGIIRRYLSGVTVGGVCVLYCGVM